MTTSYVQRRQGAVACPHEAATQVGAEVLASGGNALDAAVAMNAALTVVYPHMSGLGGDAFILYYSAGDRRVSCLNGSGPAPRLATREAFIERGLDEIPARGPLAATVPGTVRAWNDALARFGTRTLGELLAPAARLAKEGVEVGDRLAAWIERSAPELQGDPALSSVFLDASGRPLAAGDNLRQPELERSFRRLIERGADDFYEGEIAAQIDAAYRAAGGFLRRDDLAGYAPQWVTPLRVPYRGLDVVTTPPNSQGITALMMLNALTVLDSDAAPGSAEHVDALIQAKRFAFAERDRYVTDPDFVDVPVEWLLTVEHAREGLATPPAVEVGSGGGDTVYLCASDSDGNACSLIQSIFFAFGSCFVAGESGIVLQNRGHYFSLDEEHPNRLDPGKRTLHTLMACMAFDAGERGEPRLVFGTMGADGQAQTNVQVLERHRAGDSPQEAVDAPRILHGRFFPDDDPTVLSVEEGLGPDTIEGLAELGHDPQVLPAYDERLGHAHAIELHPDGTTRAGSDPRSDGRAAVVD